MRSFSVALCAVLVAASAACVKRPPPIKSSPGATGEAPPECPVTTGIDERGDPACAPGCAWDKATRQCAPAPAAAPATPAAAPSADPAPPASADPASSTDPAPGQPLPQLPPPSKKSPPLSPSDSI